MLDQRTAPFEQALFKKQLSLIETLTKERDDMHEKFNNQVLETSKLENSLLREVEKSDKQSERQSAIILYLLEERKSMLLEIHRMRSKIDKTEDSFLSSHQASIELRAEIANLQLTNSSLREENHRLTMETRDLRDRLSDQSKDLASLAQRSVFTPRHHRSMPKTNPNVRDPRQPVVSVDGQSQTPKMEIPRRFASKQKKEMRRSVPNLHFENSEAVNVEEKPKKGLLKRLSLRLVSPNVAKE